MERDWDIEQRGVAEMAEIEKLSVYKREVMSEEEEAGYA